MRITINILRSTARIGFFMDGSGNFWKLRVLPTSKLIFILQKPKFGKCMWVNVRFYLPLHKSTSRVLYARMCSCVIRGMSHIFFKLASAVIKLQIFKNGNHARMRYCTFLIWRIFLNKTFKCDTARWEGNNKMQAHIGLLVAATVAESHME